MQAEAAKVVLPEYVTSRLNRALVDGKPMVVGYVDEEGRPQLSLRGSTHVLGQSQLAIWVRHADGQLVRSIATNPNVSVLYRDSTERTTFVFSGRARVDNDEATRKEVFEGSPQPEQDHDPERHGVAVVIDLDRAVGGTVGGFQLPT